MPILLFLCTGNYYRSRFAEYLFNALAQQRGLAWSATSRGLAIERGIHNVGPVAAVALAALAARGIVPAPPLPMPAQVRDDDFTAAQRVIALYEREHRPLVEQRYPAWAGRVVYWQTPDVGELTPAAALAQIEHAVEALIEQLARDSTP